jgi:hypothetical protein
VRPGEVELVRVRSEDELSPGMTLWLDEEPPYHGRTALVLLGFVDIPPGYHCPSSYRSSTHVLRHTMQGARKSVGMCPVASIEAGRLWRLRDAEKLEGQTTSKRQPVTA